MKLFYSPSACSLSPHIVLHELGLEFSLEKVDLGTKKTSDGSDFLSVNPKGQIPVLVLDDGTTLTEGVAIVQFLADGKPESGLMPPLGSIERARVQEMLNFISSELHIAFGPLFNPAIAADALKFAKANVAKKLDHLESQLSDGRAWLAGDSFSPADTYGFAVTRWAPMKDINLTNWPSIAEWQQKVNNRAAVRAALDAEA